MVHPKDLRPCPFRREYGRDYVSCCDPARKNIEITIEFGVKLLGLIGCWITSLAPSRIKSGQQRHEVLADRDDDANVPALDLGSEKFEQLNEASRFGVSLQ